MAPSKKIKQQPQPSSPSQSTALGLSAFHERRRVLEEEHEWLLKQIQRKRKELKKFLDEIRSVATEMFAQASPIYQKLMELDTEIHDLFEQIFTTRKLGKKSQQDITKVYRNLQFMGIISPKFDQDEDEDDEELDEMFNDTSEDNFFNKNAHYSPENESSQFTSESAYKSPESKQIRQTFLKLASLFHPDKVTDEETQMRHNEIMKEVNRAYQEGDIARLLELERQHHLQEEIDFDNSSKSDIEKACNRREKDNQLLKTQYENLKRELRLARNTPEGEMVKDYRACQKEGIDPIEEILSEMKGQLELIENIRDFVRDFLDKKITIQQFLKGPSLMRKATAEEEEEMFEMLLENLLGLK